MPIGIIVNSLSLAAGGLIGFVLKDKIPAVLKVSLPLVFGVISMAMGVVSIQKVNHLPSMVLAVIAGTIIGELLQLEGRLHAMVKSFVQRFYQEKAQEINLEVLIGIIVLFCASGTGIYGAMESRLLGDHSLLFTKSFLDFFTSMIFGTVLGAVVCFIAIPQLILFLLIFFAGGLLLPYATPAMIQNLTACGGVIMLATGLRISDIKQISVVNMLPALLLVMPLTSLYLRVFP